MNSSNIFALLLIAASVGLFFMFINPQYMAYQENVSAVAARDAAINEAKQLAQTTTDLQTKQNGISQQKLDMLSRMIPEGVDTIRLNMDIKQIASNHAILLKKIDMDTSAVVQAASSGGIGSDQNAYGSLNLSLSVTTTYDNFQKFLSDMEHSLRIMDITSVSVSESKESVGSYDFLVRAKTYWLKS